MLQNYHKIEENSFKIMTKQKMSKNWLKDCKITELNYGHVFL